MNWFDCYRATPARPLDVAASAPCRSADASTLAHVVVASVLDRRGPAVLAGLRVRPAREGAA